MLLNQTILSFCFSLQLIFAGIPTSVLQGAHGEIHPHPVDRLSQIDRFVENAIVEQNTPGAVVLVGYQGKIIFEKAYGNRSLEPFIEPMTVDTIFDIASLTKVVATTPAAMMLLQQGKLKLDDSVAKFIPAFARRGKGKITIRHLLIHYSGLPSDLRLPKKRKVSAKSVLTQINQIKPVASPGEQFIYSDLGFIVLGKVIERVSGMNLDKFTQQNIFTPLMMKSTRFRPSVRDRALIAPTERGKDGRFMRGQVHDPLAAALGGVAGDAGLFSTAEDLARFCEMLLNLGSLNGVQILSPDVVRQMGSPQSPPLKQNIRGFGWDIQSTYSSVKGCYFSSRSYGHTGYTGTSLWIDPETHSYLIILTNRVHPDGKGKIKQLRMEIADVVGAAVHPAIEGSPAPEGEVPLGCPQGVSSN
jgi:CubicO group peptidase (beta-lactamase class C family)